MVVTFQLNWLPVTVCVSLKVSSGDAGICPVNIPPRIKELLFSCLSLLISSCRCGKSGTGYLHQRSRAVARRTHARAERFQRGRTSLIYGGHRLSQSGFRQITFIVKHGRPRKTSVHYSVSKTHLWFPFLLLYVNFQTTQTYTYNNNLERNPWLREKKHIISNKPAIHLVFPVNTDGTLWPPD